ncbi:MAG: SDR family oxidoreductase [bacterium]|nr:SDR family oxidoreductase [bacterium]
MNHNHKIALITGANSGLGKATAIGLAKRGYHVVMVARNRERGEIARQEIIQSSGSSSVTLMLADLSSQKDIHTLAKEFTQQYQRLDLLVNNVGNSFMQRETSPDDIEMSLAVNHLASFLLTQLLLDIIKSSAPARIVNVGTRLNTSIHFDDIQWESRRYKGLSAYAESKLGNLHFTVELARRLANTGVTVNCVHPGVFRSNLGKHASKNPLLLDIVSTLSRPFLTPAEKAAERVLYVATAPELQGITGKYYGNRQELEMPAQVLDVSANQHLWELSTQLTQMHLAIR